jgi:hypothetical protein
MKHFGVWTQLTRHSAPYPAHEHHPRMQPPSAPFPTQRTHAIELWVARSMVPTILSEISSKFGISVMKVLPTPSAAQRTSQYLRDVLDDVAASCTGRYKYSQN